MPDPIKQEASSSLFLANYLGDELNDWAKQLIPLATDSKTRERLQISLKRSEELRRKRAEKMKTI